VRRPEAALLVAVYVTLAGVARARGREGAADGSTLAGHRVVLDQSGRLLSWVEPQASAYDRILKLAWEQLLTGFPVEENGLPTWLAYCCFDGQTLRGGSWPHNPACVYAGLARGAAAYHAYSGDRRVVDLVRRVLDYQLENGTTPADSSWAWPSVPYASSDHGALRYRGAHDFRYATEKDGPPRLGRGDGYGVIEPDKVGELGLGYLVAWKITGDARYRDAALHCGRALAAHVRSGDAERSPWPFRVVAETGVVREEYGASLGPTLELLDELARLDLGQDGEAEDFRRARRTAWDWLLAQPFRTDAWANYFEDLFWLPKPTNLNQYAPGELARYVLEDPRRDPAWREHAAHLIGWIEDTFGGDTPKEKGRQWGAVTISEQTEYAYKMGSHTARFASLQALWHEKTGDAAAREKAFRAFNWASYMCDRRGVVRVGPVESSFWFSDGYGDYLRHFMAGLGAVPEWAPPGEDHLLRSTSVVTKVDYAPGWVAYETFDDVGEEVLRLSFVPKSVTAAGKPLARAAEGPGWTFDAGLGVLRVRRQGARTMAVSGTPASPHRPAPPQRPR
jgi:hypothetical protein